ncbi:MAG: membrane protein insertion efficiency factor YidD [Puniceicoccales bacterium]|nr:membrane protein insertion efficiency factor YidD [Puniceicoccales bacterium]
MGKFFVKLLILPVRFYQLFLSPCKIFFFGPHCHCRFSPTCSHFAVRVLQKYSPLKALLLIAIRLLKCQPLYRKKL